MKKKKKKTKNLIQFINNNKNKKNIYTSYTFMLILIHTYFVALYLQEEQSNEITYVMKC